jgi:primosomal protein N''
MAKTQDEEIEALARALLRETIERSGWYPALRGKFRQERIEQDIERHWHLMVPEARKRREQVELHADEIEAGQAQLKRRGYRDL